MKIASETARDTQDDFPQRDRPLARVRQFIAEWSARSLSERLVLLVRGIGVVILTAIPVTLWFFDGTAAFRTTNSVPAVLPIAWTGCRIVWTVVIALLPLFIVAVGFYTWRRICPLAFFGRLSEWVEWPDTRGTPNAKLRRKRVSPWTSIHYPLITIGFLALMLMARILLINTDAKALACTFAGLCLLAALCSFRYTGKSWCNFFCPVGAIERIYTDADRPNYRRNSQCEKCTGCKTVPSGGLCPDINQENDYWQELKNRSRAVAFYVWPGIVFGFYLWYYLHKPYYWHTPGRKAEPAIAALFPALPGTDWGYYLSGDWTRTAQPWREWLSPGFGFHGLPQPLASVPTLLAAPLTLLSAAFISFCLFKLLEVGVVTWAERCGSDRQHVSEATRHSLFSIAGFTGFVCFYQFAGAPTLAHLPFGLYGAFRFGVTIFATTVLVTRLRRTRARQLQYDQARRWLQRWPLPDVAAPKDLEEAHHLVTERLRTSEDRTRLFQNMVSGMISDNLITAAEIGLLERTGEDLGLGEADKKKVARQLSSEHPGLFTGTLSDGLRLLGYRTELERAMAENRGVLPDPKAMQAMQMRYQIAPGEHETTLKQLRDPHGSRSEYLQSEVEKLQALRTDVALLSHDATPAVRFLVHELQRLLEDKRAHVLEVAGVYGPSVEWTSLASRVRRNDANACAQAAEWLRLHLPTAFAETVAEAVCVPLLLAPLSKDATAVVQTLLRRTEAGDLVMRAAALYALSMGRASNPALRDAAHERVAAFLTSSESLLREAAVAALAPDLTADQWKAALQDPSVSVRRGAIQRLPRPLPKELNAVVHAACEDADPIIRAKVAAMEGSTPSLEEQPVETLTTLEKMFVLRSLSLLSHLSSDALLQLASRAEEQIFHFGEYLCKEGDPGDAVYLLVEGQTEAVREVNGQEVRLGINRTGECVGEMAILDPGPRMAMVRALDPFVRVLKVHGEDFRDLLARDTTTSIGVIRLLIQRQRSIFQESRP